MELEQYLNPHKRINLMSYPYPFGVIHDFFKPEMYQQLVDAFQLWIPDAEPLGKIGDHDELYYGALCYTPSIQSLLQGPQSLLISKELQNYICQFFSSDKESVANEYVILGAHQHTPPTETSWKHTDFNIVSFAKNKTAAPGYLNAWEPSDCNYTEDTRDAQPETVKVCRYIACIYYLNNQEWSVKNGGETGIYSGYSDDLPLVGKVAPRNNTLFFFEINPLSYHCAQGTNHERNTFIWWYHASPAYQFFKNQRLLAYKKQHFGENSFEWWGKPDKIRWSVQQDPFYKKFGERYTRKK